MRNFFLIFALIALGGCQSYSIVQRNMFADDDTNVVVVDYGRSDTDHVNTFVSPVTQKKMEFKSRLVVEVTLPDGDSFTAWQCMNFGRRGTMYATDDEAWHILMNGFSCTIFHRVGETDYVVYQGVLCDTPEMKVEKNDKWREVLSNKREYKHPKPISK